MPKGPQGQKRPADGIGCAVLVGKIATGEEQEEVAYATASKGSAGGKARAQHLSDGERTTIAKAGAAARWSTKESVVMTERNRLMAALFDRPGKEHIDVKFFVVVGLEAVPEDFCRDAADLIDCMHDDEGCDETFAETFADREVAEFLA